MISAIILQFDEYGELSDHEYMVKETDQEQLSKFHQMLLEAYEQRRDFTVEFMKRSD